MRLSLRPVGLPVLALGGISRLTARTNADAAMAKATNPTTAQTANVIQALERSAPVRAPSRSTATNCRPGTQTNQAIPNVQPMLKTAVSRRFQGADANRRRGELTLRKSVRQIRARACSRISTRPESVAKSRPRDVGANG